MSSSLELVKFCLSISRHKSPLKSDSRKRVFRLTDSRSFHRLARCVTVYSSSLNGDKNQSKGDEEDELKETGNISKMTATTPTFDQSLLNQRERSLTLNSEGLEGLIPRARILLTIGGTFFLSFWPFIVLTFGAFSALYLYFGADFVHDGSRTPVSPPPYIDPYSLMEDERFSRIDPRVN